MTNRAIDTSKWDGRYGAPPIPLWAQLIEEAVVLVVHKVSEFDTIDEMFYANAGAVGKLGLRQSGYHYWHPADTTRTEKAFARSCQAFGVVDPAYGVWLDFEPAEPSIPNVSQLLLAAMNAIGEVLGRPPGIYTGLAVWNRHFPTPPAWVSQKDEQGNFIHNLWLAQYPNQAADWSPATQWDPASYSFRRPALPRGWDPRQLKLWQFSDDGRIPGFPSSVDLNHEYPDGLPPVGQVTRQARVINANNLNVRAGPGTNYAIIGSLPRGTVVTAIVESPDPTPGWAHIIAPQDGWVSETYLQYF